MRGGVACRQNLRTEVDIRDWPSPVVHALNRFALEILFASVYGRRRKQLLQSFPTRFVIAPARVVKQPEGSTGTLG